jgi:Enoyl-(Acyl carrier protein) reductase
MSTGRPNDHPSPTLLAIRTRLPEPIRCCDSTAEAGIRRLTQPQSPSQGHRNEIQQTWRAAGAAAVLAALTQSLANAATDPTPTRSDAGGFGVACAAIEGLSRTLAAELGPHGVRVVDLPPHRLGDSGLVADPRVGDDEFRRWLEDMTLLKRLPTLAEVADTAVFVASDHAAAMTGAVANLTAGMSVD